MKIVIVTASLAGFLALARLEIKLAAVIVFL